MKKHLRLILTVFGIFAMIASAGAQGLVKVTGVVTSAEDGLPMIGVGVMAGPGTGVITSLDGADDAAGGCRLVRRSVAVDPRKQTRGYGRAFGVIR